MGDGGIAIAGHAHQLLLVAHAATAIANSNAVRRALTVSPLSVGGSAADSETQLTRGADSCTFGVVGVNLCGEASLCWLWLFQ